MDTPSSSLQICTTRSSGSASMGFKRCSLVVRSGRATIKRMPALLIAVIRSAARNLAVSLATFHVLQRVAMPVMDLHSLYTTNRRSRKDLNYPLHAGLLRDTASPSWYNERTHATARFIQTLIRLQKKRRAQEEQYEEDYHHFVLGTFLAALYRQCAGRPWQGRIPRGETAQQGRDATPQASRSWLENCLCHYL